MTDRQYRWVRLGPASDWSIVLFLDGVILFAGQKDRYSLDGLRNAYPQLEWGPAIAKDK